MGMVELVLQVWSISKLMQRLLKMLEREWDSHGAEFRDTVPLVEYQLIHAFSPSAVRMIQEDLYPQRIFHAGDKVQVFPKRHYSSDPVSPRLFSAMNQLCRRRSVSQSELFHALASMR